METIRSRITVGGKVVCDSTDHNPPLTEQEVDKVEMDYMILVKDDCGDSWEVFAEVTGSNLAKRQIEKALEDYHQDRVKLCVIKEFGVKMEVEI